MREARREGRVFQVMALGVLTLLLGAAGVLAKEEKKEGEEKKYKHVVTCEGATGTEGQKYDAKVSCDKLALCIAACTKRGGTVPEVAPARGRTPMRPAGHATAMQPAPPRSVEVPDAWGGSSFEGCAWTPWLNRDNPGGSGDFEVLTEFVKAGQACESPKKIECQTVDGRSAERAGQRSLCDLRVGSVCDNRKLPPGQRCLDYRVRFCC